MNQAAATCQVDIDTQFGRHNAGQLSHFNGVTQYVLTVTRTIPQTSEGFDDFRMKAVNTRFIRSLFPGFTNLLTHFFTSFFNHFFDSCRMNTPVDNQFFQSQSGHFPTNGVETGQNNSFRRIVDNQINARQCFDGSDITAFTTDNAPLHFIIRQGYDGHRRFRHVIGCTSLNSQGNNFQRLLFRFFFGFIFKRFNKLSRFMLDFRLYVGQKQLFRIVVRKFGNSFQLCQLLFM